MKQHRLAHVFRSFARAWEIVSTESPISRISNHPICGNLASGISADHSRCFGSQFMIADFNCGDKFSPISPFKRRFREGNDDENLRRRGSTHRSSPRHPLPKGCGPPEDPPFGFHPKLTREDAFRARGCIGESSDQPQVPNDRFHLLGWRPTRTHFPGEDNRPEESGSRCGSKQ